MNEVHFKDIDVVMNTFSLSIRYSVNDTIIYKKLSKDSFKYIKGFSGEGVLTILHLDYVRDSVFANKVVLSALNQKYDVSCNHFEIF